MNDSNELKPSKESLNILTTSTNSSSIISSNSSISSALASLVQHPPPQSILKSNSLSSPNIPSLPPTTISETLKSGDDPNQQPSSSAPTKRPRGRPPLSSKNKDSQSQQDLPQTPVPHQPSKAKVGAVLRDATQKILTRLMTEDPIPIGELQSLCTDLPPEQTQDILDILRVMGLVQSVRQRRKKQKLQHLPGEDSGTMDTISLPQNNSDVVNSNTSHYNELYYTMVGHARGPNVPIGILTGLSKDMTERNKRHQDTLQRIESLQSLLNQIESSSTSSSSSLSSSSSSSNPPVALLAAYLRETKKENPQFVASHGLYQTLWDMTVSKNKA